jgi:hypothetical protein
VTITGFNFEGQKAEAAKPSEPNAPEPRKGEFNAKRANDADYVVSELRSLCQSRDQTRSEAAQKLGEAYAVLCRKANQRLQRCDDLLHRGFYEEAIQLAEQKPALVDLVSQLQFDSLDVWEQVAAAYEYAPPPRIQIQSAEALNKAYSLHADLKPLFEQQRKLALTRAPLSERLAVLRQIATADSTSSAWMDDLTAYEEARQREIRTELDQAFSRRDDLKTRKHLRELLQTPWQAPLRAEFLRPIVKQYLDVLSRGFDDTLKRNDAELGRQLLEEFERVPPLIEIDLDGPLARRVAQVRSLVKRHDKENVTELQFQSSLLELKNGMEAGCKRNQLIELYNTVVEFQRPIPKSLLTAYENKLRQLYKNEKQFEMIALIATPVVIILVVIAICFFSGR